MLVRRMKNGDTLRIGEAVIHVRSATEDTLNIAIDAPRDVKIRHEPSGNPVPEARLPLR